METFSALLVLCVGNSSVTGDFQRPVTRSFGVLFDLHLNKRLSKQWWGWWFEVPWRSIWRQCNVDTKQPNSTQTSTQTCMDRHKISSLKAKMPYQTTPQLPLPSSNTLPTHHYDDVIMSTIASQITSLTIVYSTIYSGADQSKHQSSASLAFVWGIHRGPVNSPHKWPVTRKMFPFDDVIMWTKLFLSCFEHFCF